MAEVKETKEPKEVKEERVLNQLLLHNI